VANTPYHIKIAPAAQRQIRALPPKSQKLMIKFIEALAINPRPPGAARIEGMMGLYREDVNHHRLIYKVEEQEILLLLVK
jgi:mRNA interferase RelE/StbE